MTGLRGRWWRSSDGAGCGIHALAIFVDLARQVIEVTQQEVEEIDDVPCVLWSCVAGVLEIRAKHICHVKRPYRHENSWIVGNPSPM
jgi:hypothetical protein